MIWTIVSKAEMEGYKIPPVFQYYREVIGKENISLAVVDEDDPLDFVKPHDVILLRTASERLIESIERKGVASTAESYSLYRQVQDKAGLGQFLWKYGVLVPYQFTLGKATVNRRYFVKPRYGSESFGITPQCICNNQAEVAAQVERLYTELGQESSRSMWMALTARWHATMTRSSRMSVPMPSRWSVMRSEAYRPM